MHTKRAFAWPYKSMRGAAFSSTIPRHAGLVSPPPPSPACYERTHMELAAAPIDMCLGGWGIHRLA